jgi:hypothetical protein
MNEIMKENLDLQGEELGDSYPTQEWFLGESSRVIWATFPPLTGKNLQKNSKQKLVGNAAKHTQNVKNFWFYTEFFYIKICK